MDAEQLDALVNAYLFDIGLFKDTQEEEQIQLLCQQHKKISSSLSLLKASELEQLAKKYQGQIEEMIGEIEWRKNRGKMRDTSLEESESALGEILDQIHIQLRGVAKTKYSPREIQKKKADKVLQTSQYQETEFCEDVEFDDDFREFEEDYEELEPEFESTVRRDPLPKDRTSEISERVKKLTTKIDKMSSERTHGDRSTTEKARTGDKPTAAKAKMSNKSTVRKPFPEKSIVKKSSDRIEKTVAKKQASKAKASKTGRSPGKTKKASPAKTPEIAETKRAPAPPPPQESQEERISTMINKYLHKRPNISWQERDRRDKEKQQKLFEKELQLKKERERFREEQAKKRKKKKRWF